MFGQNKSLMLIAMLLLLIAQPLRGAEPTSRPGADRGRGAPVGDRILDRSKEIVGQLQLSDEQKTKVDAIFRRRSRTGRSCAPTSNRSIRASEWSAGGSSSRPCGRTSPTPSRPNSARR